MYILQLINIQISFIKERCKRIALLFDVINPITTLIVKTTIDLIADLLFLLCTILIPITFLLLLWNFLSFF